MRPYRQTMTLQHALSDPLIQTVMAADDVDPRELATMLSEIAWMLDDRSKQASKSGAFGLSCRMSPC